SLRQAGANLTIELAEPSTKYVQGDLRLTSIVLEEDPLAMNVIGYGPSVANPLTGEIVNARTVMYLGTLKKFVKESYNELVIEKMMEDAAENNKADMPAAANAVAVAQSGYSMGDADL